MNATENHKPINDLLDEAAPMTMERLPNANSSEKQLMVHVYNLLPVIADLLHDAVEDLRLGRSGQAHNSLMKLISRLLTVEIQPGDHHSAEGVVKAQLDQAVQKNREQSALLRAIWTAFECSNPVVRGRFLRSIDAYPDQVRNSREFIAAVKLVGQKIDAEKQIAELQRQVDNLSGELSRLTGYAQGPIAHLDLIADTIKAFCQPGDVETHGQLNLLVDAVPEEAKSSVFKAVVGLKRSEICEKATNETLRQQNSKLHAKLAAIREAAKEP